MKQFWFGFLIVLVLAGVTGYYALQQGLITAPEPSAQSPRKPLDYHILGDQGGIPLDEASRGGLVTGEYAYLYGMEPIHMDGGVATRSDVKLGGREYDMAYVFASAKGEQQSLEFNLLGNWTELHFGFGYMDSEASDPNNKWGNTLTIQVDGEPVFKSERLSPVEKPVFHQIDVSGANRLTFIVKRFGSGNPFAPVLVDPFVLK